jgi:hypothetical protein
MANIIDALVVTLGLDAKDYKKGQREAEESMRKFGKNSEEQSKKVAESSKKNVEGFSAVTKSLLALGGVALAVKGVSNFFTTMVAGQAALGRTAHLLNMSGKSLDAWGMSIGVVHGKVEDITNSLKNLQSGIFDTSIGVKNDVGIALNNLKVDSIDKTTGKFRDLKDVMLDLADALSKKSPQAQVLFAKKLGFDENTLNLLIKGRKAVSDIYDAEYKLSNFTDEGAAKAEKYEESWAKLSGTFKGIKEDIFNNAVPALDALDSVLNRIIKGGDSPWTKFFASIKDLPKFKFGLVDKSDPKNKLPPSDTEMPKFDWDSLHKKYPWTDPNGGGDPNYSKVHAAKEKQKLKSVTPILPSEMSSSGHAVKPASKSEADLFANLEKQNSIPAGTLDKLWKIESARGKNMVSPAGATGHFQFMPETAKDFGMSTADTYDLTKSATAASKYIAQLLKMFNGDMQKAVSAYNWGSGNVQRKGLEHAPLETLNYWKKFNNGNQVTSNKNTSEVSIASLNIYTQATDSAGIARDMKSQLQQNMLITGSATGMN